MCQGFCHLSGFLHHFVLVRLATSSKGLELNSVHSSGLSGIDDVFNLINDYVHSCQG